MQAQEKVLPHSPQYREIVLAKNQPEYIPLPVACVSYNDCTGLISRYRLTLWERLHVLIFGNLWVEQLTAGQLQPQRLTVFEPFTEADVQYSKQQECEMCKAGAH